MKIEKIIAKLEKAQDKINAEFDSLRDMLEDHLEEMQEDEIYDESDEDLSDDEDLDSDEE